MRSLKRALLFFLVALFVVSIPATFTACDSGNPVIDDSDPVDDGGDGNVGNIVRDLIFAGGSGAFTCSNVSDDYVSSNAVVVDGFR